MNTPWPGQWRGACIPLLLVLSFLVATPALRAAADNELGQNAFTLALPAGRGAAEVRDAIINALNRREWTVKSQSGSRVVAYLKHRTNEATVTFVYSATQIEAFCVGWAIDKKTGARLKPEQPRGWLNNLRSDIMKLLNRGSAVAK